MQFENIWVVSDHHFGHHNILKFTNRYRILSNDLEEAEEELIRRWNEVVPPNGVVFHLGDVAFTKRGLSKLARCNGNKQLIMGNHDKFETSLYLEYFSKVHGCKFIQDSRKGIRSLLTHFPVEQRQVGPHDYGKRLVYNIHGHIHSPAQLIQSPWYKCMCVDTIPHYKPIRLMELVF